MNKFWEELFYGEQNHNTIIFICQGDKIILKEDVAVKRCSYLANLCDIHGPGTCVVMVDCPKTIFSPIAAWIYSGIFNCPKTGPEIYQTAVIAHKWGIRGLIKIMAKKIQKLTTSYTLELAFFAEKCKYPKMAKKLIEAYGLHIKEYKLSGERKKKAFEYEDKFSPELSSLLSDYINKELK